MKSPLYILHLEDNPNDAKLIRAALEIDGIACATTCVKTQAEFVAALESGGFDLVLSDFSLSGFDGLSAAEIVHTHWPALPFIFVSGTMVEERAGAALEGRVMDYVPKYDLLLLASAVRCAMEKSDGDHGELPCISRHHDLAMFCLPPDGRWQTESQLIGQSRLGNRVRRIYRNLAATGYCELKIVPILDHLGETEDFMRMYRATPKMHQAYKKRPDKEKPVSMYLLSEPINPVKVYARNH